MVVSFQEMLRGSSGSYIRVSLIQRCHGTVEIMKIYNADFMLAIN